MNNLLNKKETILKPLNTNVSLERKIPKFLWKKLNQSMVQTRTQAIQTNKMKKLTVKDS